MDSHILDFSQLLYAFTLPYIENVPEAIFLSNSAKSFFIVNIQATYLVFSGSVRFSLPTF